MGGRHRDGGHHRRTRHLTLCAVLALTGIACSLSSAHAAETPPTTTESIATRQTLIELITQAVRDGKHPHFEMDMGRQSVKAQLVEAGAKDVTVNASGLSMPRPWAKLTDRHLYQMAMNLAGEDAPAQHRALAFALATGLHADAKRALDALLARDPHDREAHRLLKACETAAEAAAPSTPAAAPKSKRPTPSSSAAASKPAAPPVRVPLRANYYVAPNGNDQWPGHINQPFATLQRAFKDVKPGQLIYLRGGTYKPTTLTQFKINGQPNAYIEIHGYPGETPVIDGGAIQGSDPTWRFSKASYIRLRGPIHLTNGRGPGLFVDHDSHFIEFHEIEASYNGKKAERGGHGFFVHGDHISNLLFKNCDAHHNANHLTKPGEDVDANIYQHGDGWRIFSGKDVRLEGCRAWYNLDDAYDLTQAKESIELHQCWAAYSGLDDPKGSITGKPDWGIRRYDGDGFKLGYKTDTGPHKTIRCIAWNNFSHGWNVAGGPFTIEQCVAYNNREVAFFGIQNQANVLRNSFALKNRVGDGVWSGKALPASANAAARFVSVSDAGMLGPRGPGGVLPATDFLRPVPGSPFIDSGVDTGAPFSGRAPDLGYHEAP